MISHGLPEKNFNLLIGVTGSVAAIKLADLIKKLKSLFPQTFINKTTNKTYSATISIRIVMTENSKHFVEKNDIEKIFKGTEIEIYEDSHEWNQWNKIGDPVLHIELRKWADICIIAPLDANTMAKIATGICDNLLTCIVRAWDTSKPLIYCPAMNVNMYNHPITREQLCKLQSFGYLRVDCVEKRLACGDVGMGGMASVESISDKVVESLLRPTRNASFTRPLLNQQPTYPIISTSETKSNTNPPAGQLLITPKQLMDRFKSNQNQTSSLHHNRTINNNNNRQQTIPSLNLSSNVITRQQSKTMKQAGLMVHNRNNQTNGTSSSKQNCVTSIQNLRAIDHNGEQSTECTDDTDSDGNNLPDMFNYDLDPSKLLEQSMVTDETEANEHELGATHSNSNSSNSKFNHHGNFALREDIISEMDCLTPLFNTSKFLALCHNKERGCFTCTICKNDYKNRKSMARHLKEQHVQGSIYQCIPCGVSYKRREKLIKHNRDRHSGAQPMK